jgi:hypothetical protein
VSSYSVSPALPPGLSLNGTTGIISGTPTEATGYKRYMVTASNAGGSTEQDVDFEVINSLYLSSYYSFTVNVGATVMPGPAANAGAPVWSVAPPLPAGLSLNSSYGLITGAPTAALAPANYVVSAKTAGATSTASLTLAVTNAPLLDLGHVTAVGFARFGGSSLLTQDDNGHWVLWNYATGQNLASGTSPEIPPQGLPAPAPVDLEGSTVVIQTSAGLEVRAAADGHVLAEITATPTWWRLASDGSYLCAGNASGLTAWSPAGTVLFSRAGDYSTAIAFAAPGQVQLALGPAGANVIQTLIVPSGISSTGPAFAGQFRSWFLDGGRYFTALNNTVWVYSNASVQQDLASLTTVSQLTGQGNWYWTVTTESGSPTLALYAVGSKGTATSTYPVYAIGVPGMGLVPVPGVAIPSPTTNSVAILLEGTTAGTGQVTLLDLSGAPSTTTFSTPIERLTNYAASSGSTWIVANQMGVLFDGASPMAHPRYLDYGAATAIVGSTANAVIATASGRIVYFDAATLALQGTIDQQAWQLAESADGTVLAAATGGSAYSISDPPLGISIYSLPGGTVSSSFMTPALNAIALSQSGTVLEEGVEAGGPCSAQAIALPGGAALWCGTSANGIGFGPLSPDGTLVATPVSSPQNVQPPTGNVFLNGTLVTAVTGIPIAWADNNTLFTQTFVYSPMDMGFVYTGSDLFDSTGHLIGSPPVPQIAISDVPPGPQVRVGPVQPISSTLLYDAQSNAIYSLTTGAAVWASGSPVAFHGTALTWSAVSGGYVVFESGSLILAEPR